MPLRLDCIDMVPDYEIVETFDITVAPQARRRPL